MPTDHELELRAIERQAVKVAELIHQPPATPRGDTSRIAMNPPGLIRPRGPGTDDKLVAIETQLRQVAQAINEYLQKPTG